MHQTTESSIVDSTLDESTLTFSNRPEKRESLRHDIKKFRAALGLGPTPDDTFVQKIAQHRKEAVEKYISDNAADLQIYQPFRKISTKTYLCRNALENAPEALGVERALAITAIAEKLKEAGRQNAYHEVQAFIETLEDARSPLIFDFNSKNTSIEQVSYANLMMTDSTDRIVDLLLSIDDPVTAFLRLRTMYAHIDYEPLLDRDFSFF